MYELLLQSMETFVNTLSVKWLISPESKHLQFHFAQFSSVNISELLHVIFNKGVLISLIRAIFCCHYFIRILQLYKLFLTSMLMVGLPMETRIPSLSCVQRELFRGDIYIYSLFIYVYKGNALRRRMWMLERNSSISIYSRIVWLILFRGMNEPLKPVIWICLFLKFKSIKSLNAFWNSN